MIPCRASPAALQPERMLTASQIRYLRGLVDEYHGNMKLALLVYNRGPVAVEKSRAQGENPSNGYDRILTKGYRGTGVME